MNNIFLFDVDNTLTPPRQKITADMENVFTNFIKNNKVYLISGSDYEKICWQLGEEILKDVKGVFGCLGNTFHRNNNLIKTNNFPQLESEELINDINHYLNTSSTPLRTGNHIEKRVGMLNVSTIGRNASAEQRKTYSEFDESFKERSKFADYLRNKYPHLDISIGGEISIDISVLGHGKEQTLNEIKYDTFYYDEKIIFFGDRCNVGGNDHTLAAAVRLDSGLVFNVSCYSDTKLILEKIWHGNNSIR